MWKWTLCSVVQGMRGSLIHGIRAKESEEGTAEDAMEVDEDEEEGGSKKSRTAKKKKKKKKKKKEEPLRRRNRRHHSK